MRDEGTRSPRLTGPRNSAALLGEDLVAPDRSAGDTRPRRRRWVLWRGSPLTRKIIIFNLIALNVLVAGVLYLGASRESLLQQRQSTLGIEAALISDVFEVQLGQRDAGLAQIDVAATLDGVALSPGLKLMVFGADGALLGERAGAGETVTPPPTHISDALAALWAGMTRPFAARPPPQDQITPEAQARAMADGLSTGVTRSATAQGATGRYFTTVTGIERDGAVLGAVALASSVGGIDAAVRAERERVLQMFIIATLVSIGLSVLLASTITNPLGQLADAAELGGTRDHRKVSPARVRIPDLTARPDEIGRLSGALRGMVGALYDRIDANEQFAADVAHEIKNPLASLRSAVGTLRMAARADHREKLLSVIEHDVRRLDRLVSDISNASRLDSELVKEEEQSFDLLHLIASLTSHLGEQAAAKGIDFITDLPEGRIMLQGLEGRLAQVFVNLITNAESFCRDGDAIRVWARRRENRVLVVVEDTGPGIPEEALQKIFTRFYSHRPEAEFGNNSGLGLAISKQIVEAHGGVIWAENIRPTEADITSDPLGARFVVGLPL